MEDKINNIHDKFVRESFSDVGRATSFFEKMLPPGLVEQLDFTTLKDLKVSYIDQELNEYFSDLVFEVSLTGNPDVKTDVVRSFVCQKHTDGFCLCLELFSDDLRLYV